jgi:hypothetical protein
MTAKKQNCLHLSTNLSPICVLHYLFAAVHLHSGGGLLYFQLPAAEFHQQQCDGHFHWAEAKHQGKARSQSGRMGLALPLFWVLAKRSTYLLTPAHSC